MIGIAPTKCQLSADDLSEYEACKLNWTKASPKRLVKKTGAGGAQEIENQRAKETRARIGITK